MHVIGMPAMQTLSLIPILLPASLPLLAPFTEHRRIIALSGSLSRLGRPPGSRS